MKKLVLAAVLLATGSVHAFGGVPSMPSMQFPKKGEWAIAMVSKACDIPLREMKGAKGKITKRNGKVLYTVYMDGAVYAQATAKSTFIFAKKQCL